MATNQQSISKLSSDELDVVEEAKRLMRNKGPLGSFIAECAIRYCDFVVASNGEVPDKQLVDELARLRSLIVSYKTIADVAKEMLEERKASD